MSRHRTLWFDDGNLVLQAEDMLYNVHRSIICRQSRFFGDMFLIGQTGTATTTLEGTEFNPLIVPAVTSVSFSDLLGIVYGCAGEEIRLDTSNLVHVLYAAHRYQFEQISSIVASILGMRPDSELPPLRKLALGLSCPATEDIDCWVLPALQTIALDFSIKEPFEDPDGLLSFEARRLIADARAKIVRGREDWLIEYRAHILQQPQGGSSLAPIERVDLVKEIITQHSRDDWFKKGVELRIAKQPRARSFSNAILDLSQELLERYAPPHTTELSLIERVWVVFNVKSR